MWRGAPLLATMTGEILFYQKTLFFGDSGRYVKEDSGNGHLSP